MKKKLLVYALLLLVPIPAFSMHIAEGFLPARWCIIWALAFIPFLVLGYKQLKQKIDNVPQAKMLYAVVGAFVFVLSSLKLPSVAGSSSHLTGIGIGTLLFGASSMSVIGVIVLLFQALLLAHGGLTTLGANAFSMAVVGAYTAVGVYKLSVNIRIPKLLAIFLATFFADISTYLCTSFQLGVAFQSQTASILDNTLKFLSIFAVSQLPLAIVEGILSVMFYQLLVRYNSKEIKLLSSI